MGKTISIAMIVKDEAYHLRECLASVEGLADEICIVDTGSRDDSLTIARELGAKTSVFIWCDDFSAARNESLRLCTKDWVFCLDADERLDPAEIPKIRAMVNRAENACFWLPIRNYTNTTTVSEFVTCAPGDPWARGFAGWYPATRVRLFPNGTAAKYEGKVHELIGPSLERLGFRRQRCDVDVHHYPLINRDLQHIRDKQEYYLRLGHDKVKAQPDNPQAYSELGDQYAEVKDYQSAVAGYREALRLDPANPANLANLGGALHMIGRDDDARQALLLATQLNPDLADAWCNLGVVYADEKDWHGAAECFRKALQSNPGWLEGHRYLSVALEGMAHLPEAAEHARKAFEAFPTSQDCLRLYTHQMLRLERRVEARDFILKIMEGGVDDANLHNAVGELFFYDKLLDEAKAHFQHAGEMGLAAAYNNLGVVLFSERRFLDARAAFEQCLSLDPGHRGARNNIAKTLGHVGANGNGEGS